MKSQDDVRLALGRRVREFRRDRGLTLDDLGRKVSLSAPTLSKIENATLSVTYDTLLSLAEALSVDVTDFFGDRQLETPAARRVVNRAGEGDIYDAPVYQYEMLCTDLSNKKMIPIVAVIKANSIQQFPALISHDGEEFIYVVEGSVELHTAHYAPVILRKGDSAYYDSRMGHAVIAVGGTEAKILWTCTNVQGTGLDNAQNASRRVESFA